MQRSDKKMSIKARFQQQQPPVDIRQMGRMAYIFICLNETQGTETYPDMGEGQTQETYYEYDYNEFRGKEGELDLEDIKSNPEKYLDFVTKEDPVTKLDKALAKIGELEKQIANTNAQLINNTVEE